MNIKEKKLQEFIDVHILQRPVFEDYLKEPTPHLRASKAFYAVWTNFIYINPTTENLRELKQSDFEIIQRLSYGSKNRLQSYIAYHLKKDHYLMKFEDFSEMESISTIEMCREIFDDTKILSDWWRNSIDNIGITGEDWFQECRLKYQERKQINKLCFNVLNLKTKLFLKYDGITEKWVQSQDDSTSLNCVCDNLILDQHNQKTQVSMGLKLKDIISDKASFGDIKIFVSSTGNDFYNFNI